MVIHPSVLIRNPKGISIGDRVNVNHGCELYGSGGIEIGEGSMIAYNVMIFSDSRTYKGREPLKDRSRKRIKKPVQIGADVWVGAGSSILPGVKLGNHCIVAAGSVVINDVQEWEMVGGNPAKRIGSRLDESN